MSLSDVPNRPRTKRVTITDIAREARVSPATASHVFSGHRPVSSAARASVLEVASRLNYTPNTTAQALASGRSMVVAVFVPFDADDLAASPFFAPTIVEISTSIAHRGYALLMLPAGVDAATASATDLIRDHRVDGLIMIDPTPSDRPIAKIFASHGLPFVVMGKLDNALEAPWVDGDVFAQYTDALDHLEKQGYRRPALVNFPGAQSVISDVRNAYLSWTAERGIIPVICVMRSALDMSVDDIVDSLLITDVDSLVCVDDAVAVTLIQKLESLGISGIGVVGTGDTRHARFSVPPLTSIASRAADRTRLAADLLIELILGLDPENVHIIVKHELVARESTRGVTNSRPRSIGQQFRDRHPRQREAP